MCKTHIRSVCGSEHNDACVALETIHLCEQLVDGLLAFVIAAAHASTSLPSDGINLIDEDNAWSLCLGLPQSPDISTTMPAYCAGTGEAYKSPIQRPGKLLACKDNCEPDLNSSSMAGTRAHLLKEVTDARSTHSHKELHEL